MYGFFPLSEEDKPVDSCHPAVVTDHFHTTLLATLYVGVKFLKKTGNQLMAKRERPGAETANCSSQGHTICMC